jgi:hypothetical protein
MSAHRVTGLIFYDDTVHAVRYANNIQRQFFAELTEEERLYGVFQHGSAAPHMARVSLEALREVCDDRVIGRGLWPPLSPDLKPCDFYLWGSLKNKVYKTDPHTLEEVRHDIRREISTVSGEEFQKVNNVFRRYTECIWSGGQHFSICCSTGEFLLDFIKVITTAIAYRLAPFTHCYPNRDAAYGARAAELAAADYASSRKNFSLYLAAIPCHPIVAIWLPQRML